MTNDLINVSEEEARRVAEESREAEWTKPSFMKELFLGNFRFDLLHPYPVREQWSTEFQAFENAFKEFLSNEVDPDEIDRIEDYPDHVVDGLAKLGAFGLKIPKKYGGMGFDQVEYAQIMEIIGSYDANLGALLSAHQSIGVPQPLILFGTEDQRQKYLPRCAAGEISAFALTEPEVGSDPARVSTTAELTEDGSAYIMNGTKLWCTNGTKAGLLVVMAKHPGTHKISAFIVETAWEGVTVERRCHFMGLKALANGVITFNNVRVPVENLVGKEGRGLKIALTTLNDGRLSIPNQAVGAAKLCLQIVREFGSERVQWGQPVGKHEAVSQKIAGIAATTFAMESIVKITSHMSNNKKLDLRLESAACKEWNSSRGWEIVDETMQVRGGRGYETEASQVGRGEKGHGVERMLRDFRINRIFEGSSEIMHLLMAREAVDKHLSVAGAIIDKKVGIGGKIAALPKIAAFYAWWYPTRWLGWGRFPRFASYGQHARSMRFIERSARKLARESFHGMVVYGAKMERKQMFLNRLVDIVNLLFAMAASISRAKSLTESGSENAAEANQIANLFCRQARVEVKDLFYRLWHNSDEAMNKLTDGILDSEHLWMEELLEGIETRRTAGAQQVGPQAVPAAEEAAAAGS